MSKITKEVTYSAMMVNVIGLLCVVPLLAAYMWSYRLFFYKQLAEVPINMTLLLTGLLIISLAVHEVLHGVGWVLTKGCAAKNIHLKFRMLMASCHCDKPLLGSRYMFGLVFPFAVLVTSTIILSFLYPSNVTLFAALVNIALCGGDILLFLRLFPYRRNKIIDHPDKAGFAVVA